MNEKMIVNSKLQDVITSPPQKPPMDHRTKARPTAFSINIHPYADPPSFGRWLPTSIHLTPYIQAKPDCSLDSVMSSPLLANISLKVHSLSTECWLLCSHSTPFFTSFKAQLKDYPLLKVFTLSQSFCPLSLPTFETV